MGKEFVFPTDDFRLFVAAQQGLPFDVYSEIIAASQLPFTEWANLLHVSERTLRRMYDDKRTLDTPLSEKMLELGNLFAYGKEVFGTEETFINWLSRSVFALGYHRPLDLLVAISGIHVVHRELGRIEYGMPV